METRLDIKGISPETKELLKKIAKEMGVPTGKALDTIIQEYISLKKENKLRYKVHRVVQALAEEWGLDESVVLLAIVLKGLAHKEDVKNLASLLQLARETIE